jgi:hypothetical protein
MEEEFAEKKAARQRRVEAAQLHIKRLQQAVELYTELVESTYDKE